MKPGVLFFALYSLGMYALAGGYVAAQKTEFAALFALLGTWCAFFASVVHTREFKA
jgi:hypothetical protein